MEKQITTEELARANGINNRYNKLYLELGQNTTQTKDYLQALEALQNEAESLYSDYQRIKEDETQYAEELTNKYGEGQLDLATGILTSLG